MSRGVEARGSLWTPGVPRALGSFPGDADLPSKTTAHPAPQRNRAAELCQSTLLGCLKSESVMEAADATFSASWPDLFRPSTSCCASTPQDVDARVKPAHDD